MSAVYFIQAVEGGLIKIGRVRHVEDVDKRLRALQVGNPSQLQVLAVVRGARHESKLHEKFSHLRRSGEWFEPSPELLSYIEQVNSPVTETVFPKSPNFITWLETELARRNWTQTDLARKTGLGNSTLSRILAGTRAAGPTVCKTVAKAFSVPQEKVFRLAGLLPPVQKHEGVLEELAEVVNQLPDSEQREVLKYARYRLSNL